MENRLRIDSVPTTNSDLGPSIPDGGYGWIILLTSLFFHLLIPSMIVAFGIFLVFVRLETSAPAYPTFWDNPLIYTPLFFLATWTLIDPWMRRLIEYSKWPRLVATSGVCLACSGILFIWFALHRGTRTAPWFVVAGILSGVGASILTAQSEVIIAQYFKLKLKLINYCIQVVTVGGFILTPITLGDYIVKQGLLNIILWYGIIILQGVVVCLFIKKPLYLKSIGTPYKILKQGTNDDEIDIFAKNSRELQSARHAKTVSEEYKSIPSTSSATVTGQPSSTSEEQPPTTPSTLVDIQVHDSQAPRSDWVKFEDEPEDSSKVRTKQTLQKSFSNNSDDLERIETYQESITHLPMPLFTETHLNNNNTYAFDSGDTTSDEPVVFMPNIQPRTSFVESKLYFFRQPSFYKALLQVVCLKLSMFMFFAMFPSFVYMRIENLKIHHTTQIVGYVNCAALVFCSITHFTTPTHKMRAFFLWLSSWVGAFGYVLLTDVKSEVWFIIGSMLIIISMQSINYYGQPLLNITRKGETNHKHIAICSISGLSFLIFFVIDFSYVNCFRLLALLHFVMGGIWFANFLFKKIKPMFFNNS